MSTPVTVSAALSRLIIGLEVALSLGALAGGATLVLWPDGSAAGATLSMLEHSPFTNFLVPGLVLLVVNGVLPLVSAVAVWRRRPWAARSTVGVGTLLTGWIVVQVALLRAFTALHAVYLLLGVALVSLGLALERRRR